MPRDSSARDRPGIGLFTGDVPLPRRFGSAVLLRIARQFCDPEHCKRFRKHTAVIAIGPNKINFAVNYASRANHILAALNGGLTALPENE
jgi:hypothetical protein